MLYEPLTNRELTSLRSAARIAAATLQLMIEAAKPGVSTLELDEIAGRYMRSESAESAPAKAYGFPGFTCISISPVAAHGIPDAGVVLQPGMLVNFDVSVVFEGMFADNGASICIAPAPLKLRGLVSTARAARDAAIEIIAPGVAVRSLGVAANNVAQQNDLRIVKSLVSHGVGRSLHAYPGNIHNYPRDQERRRIKEGWVLAIEPFVTSGDGEIVELEDTWSLETEDRAPVAQFEHTVLVTKGGHEILTIPG
ncbi:MAG TPA: type I methionyl aminopeptidase [Bellilinea sp.]|nr:type I methionyl aminopeptidase [Bellilinea sp.]